jgi:alkanesulfonate monooxygenase SsuD/methylene tetrahydromethanopterin reductase-like flavin-dependent oxidoreductase (luciferase family)
MLDHLSEGRLNFGVAASGLPSDWAMFNVDGMSGANRDMTRERWRSSSACGRRTRPSTTRASTGRWTSRS